MEIKEPKFNPGDKITTLQEGKKAVGTIEGIKLYDFPKGTYVYIVRLENDDGFTYKQLYLDELVLDIYIEKPKSVWDLKKGDCYVIANIDGRLSEIHWDGIAIEKSCRNLGNCFLTKEEAEFEVERRKIETEMLRLGGRREFKYNDANYCICYNDGLCIESYPCTFNQGGIYFDSVKEAMEVVKTIGDDRIKKYIFGVNE